MNLTEHVVTEVLSKPYFNHNWHVDVNADSWGRIAETTVSFATEDQASGVKVGYSFEA